MKFPKPQRKVKARKPLLRSKPMRRRSPRRIAKETPAERYWKQWVHGRRCAGLRSFTDHVCMFADDIQQAHLRDMTGLGLKASNFDSLPMCPLLHYAYDTTSGPFAPMGKAGKKGWFLARLIEERADFVAENGCTPEEYGAARPNRTW